MSGDTDLNTNEPMAVLRHRSTSLREASSGPMVNISRPVYSQRKFDEIFKKHDDVDRDKKNQSCCGRLGTVVKTKASGCLPKSFSSFLLGLFPVISILSKYDWRQDLLRDIIAGATVSFLHVPQAMAYGNLATLQPIHGLYVAFFPGLIYFFMGTSRQMSIGVFAVTSLMIAKVLEAEIATNSYGLPISLENTPENTTTSNLSTFSNGTDSDNMTTVDYEQEELRVRVEIATSYNLIIGIMQLFLGVIGAGFVTDYLNEPFVSGYTTACACHVFTSQLWLAIGVKGVRHNGAFKIILTWKDFFIRLPKTHLITFGIFISAIVILTIWKEFIEPRVKRKISIPIPVDLILIIVVDAISFGLGLKENHGVPIVGPIPSDFPTPKIPKYFRPNYLVDSIPIVLVSFSICISMGKMLAKKYHYHIEPNQEFLAMGAGNIFGSFFSCYTASTAISRTLVQSNVGGKTQIASLVSGSIILVVILVLGSFLEPLPTSILGAVVIVNLKGMFLQFIDVHRFWRVCKLDAMTWIVAFLVTFLVDVDVGLYVGVSFVFITIIIQNAQTRFSVQRQVPSSELFASIDDGKNLLLTIPAVVLRWSSPIYFASVEKLGHAIHHETHPSDKENDSSPDHTHKLISEHHTAPITTIILDLTGVLFIDSAGVEFVKNIVPELAKMKVDLLVAGCPKHVRTALSSERSLKDFLAVNTFISTIDALVAIQSGKFHPWRKAEAKKTAEVSVVETSALTEGLLQKQEESSRV